MTPAFKELDTVVLARDVADAGLRAGDLGAIVHLHSPEAFEVEFVTASGRTQALVTLSPADIRPVSDDEEGRQEQSYELMKEKVSAELKNSFRPEFLNRIDATVVFRSLTKDEIRQIVDIQLKRLAMRLADRHLELAFTDAAKDFLAQRGYDPVYGARPLKRVISNTVETALAQKLISGEVRDGQRIAVDVGDGGVVFRSEGMAAGSPDSKRAAAG